MSIVTDQEKLDRLHQLISETMQRCMTLERAVAVAILGGFDTGPADAALAASYHSLRVFRQNLAATEQRLGGGI